MKYFTKRDLFYAFIFYAGVKIMGETTIQTEQVVNQENEKDSQNLIGKIPPLSRIK